MLKLKKWFCSSRFGMKLTSLFLVAIICLCFIPSFGLGVSAIAFSDQPAIFYSLVSPVRFDVPSGVSDGIYTLVDDGGVYKYYLALYPTGVVDFNHTDAFITGIRSVKVDNSGSSPKYLFTSIDDIVYRCELRSNGYKVYDGDNWLWFAIATPQTPPVLDSSASGIRVFDRILRENFNIPDRSPVKASFSADFYYHPSFGGVDGAPSSDTIHLVPLKSLVVTLDDYGFDSLVDTIRAHIVNVDGIAEFEVYIYHGFYDDNTIIYHSPLAWDNGDGTTTALQFSDIVSVSTEWIFPYGAASDVGLNNAPLEVTPRFTDNDVTLEFDYRYCHLYGYDVRDAYYHAGYVEGYDADFFSDLIGTPFAMLESVHIFTYGEDHTPVSLLDVLLAFLFVLVLVSLLKVFAGG